MKYQIINIPSYHLNKINEYIPKGYKIISISNRAPISDAVTLLCKKKVLGVF